MADFGQLLRQNMSAESLTMLIEHIEKTVRKPPEKEERRHEAEGVDQLALGHAGVVCRARRDLDCGSHRDQA